VCHSTEMNMTQRVRQQAGSYKVSSRYLFKEKQP
jgi:hypothetical protein